MKQIRVQKVSDIFRRFADALDQGHRLAEVADGDYQNLAKIVQALQFYGRHFLGFEVAPGFSGQICKRVPDAFKKQGGGLGE